MSARLSGVPVPNHRKLKMTSEREEDLESTVSRFFGRKEKTRRQLKKLLVRLGVQDADKVIEDLLVNGVIFEPRKDHFRLV
ncbi:MAG: hypothetical protein ACE5QF_07205 [Thermoplasmata archaeon]